MSKNQFTGSATQPQRNRKLCQFNKVQYCMAKIAPNQDNLLYSYRNRMVSSKLYPDSVTYCMCFSVPPSTVVRTDTQSRGAPCTAPSPTAQRRTCMSVISCRGPNTSKAVRTPRVFPCGTRHPGQRWVHKQRRSYPLLVYTYKGIMDFVNLRAMHYGKLRANLIKIGNLWRLSELTYTFR